MSAPRDKLEKLLNLCESEIEEIFLRAAYGRIDGLIPQYKVDCYRIDFAIPEKMIAIEIDGHDYHKTSEQRTHDTQRERCIKRALPANWIFLRFTGSEVYQDTNRCIDEVLQFINKSSFCESALTQYNKCNVLDYQRNVEDSWLEEIYALLREGDTNYDQCKYDEAIACYDEALERDPFNDDAWCNKLEALLTIGRYDDLIRACNKAIELNLSWIGYDPILIKGIALFKKGNYKGAIICFDKVIETTSRKNPLLAEAWNNKGDVLMMLGRTTEANAAYDKVKELGYTG